MRDPQTTRPDRLHSERATRGRERVTAPLLTAHIRPHILEHILDCADRALSRPDTLHELLPGLVDPLPRIRRISSSLLSLVPRLRGPRTGLRVNGQVGLHHDRHRTLTGRRRHQTVRHRRTRRTHHPKRTALVINLHVNTTAGDIPAGGCAKPQRGPEHLNLSPRLRPLLIRDED